MKSNTVKGIKTDYSAAKKQISTKFGEAKAKMAELEKHAEDYVSENPKQAVAIAASIGAILGAVTTAIWMQRKKKDDE